VIPSARHVRSTKREDLLTIGPEHWAGASLSAVLLVLVAIGVLATLLR
jgi:hypothetical protein